MTQTASTKRNTFLNKNSAYVQSLVSFILDTKPYHCKLTETIEEYQFSDDMFVKMDERLHWRNKLDGVWKYNYFSSGNEGFRTTPLSRLMSYIYRQNEHIVGVDEVADMALVPNVYDKMAYDGPGVAGVKLVRKDGSIDPLTQSVDWFESLGSFEFMIKQIRTADGKISPLWQSTMDEKLMLEAIHTIRESALDVSNPESNVNLIRKDMDEIRRVNRLNGNDARINAELDKIYVILGRPWLPKEYNDLFDAIASNPVMNAEIKLDALEIRLNYLSPGLFFGEHTDMNFREGGLVVYRSKTLPYLIVNNVNPDLFADYEEWTVTCSDVATQTFVVRGSISGYAGAFQAGSAFQFAGHISFMTKKTATPAVLGDTFTLSPSNRIAVHPNALMETWNLIKTHPLTHTRAYLTSTQYGAIYNLTNVRGSVTLIDKTIPTSTFVIKCLTPTTFQVTNSSIPGYKKSYTVNRVFNDGVIGFTIKTGSKPFVPGDKFYVSVENKPAQAADVFMTYPYDLDAYDNDHLTYPGISSNIGFYYETRYPVFDAATMRIQLDTSAVNGRQWKMVAIPDKARPVSSKKKDGSRPSPAVDLDDATSGVAPDPGITAKPRYSMDGAHESDPDLILYYASEFRLEYSDDKGATWTFVQNLNTDQTYVLPQHGLSFIIPTVPRPFIASSSYEGAGKPRIEMGDTITFYVDNPDPELLESPIGLSSPHTPRLELHSSGFYYTPSANWTVTMTSNTAYSVSAVYADGPNIGLKVPGTPLTGVIPTNGTTTREGLSFKGANVHFTIVPNRGLIKGDNFTFRTFEEKPTYVVHGSVTGFSGVAEVGKYFWNGQIGFTIQPPTHAVYKGNGDEGVTGLVKVARIRSDHVEGVYTFTKAPLGGYQLTFDNHGVKAFVKDGGFYEDDHIRIELLSANLDPLLGTTNSFRVQISVDSHETFLCPTVVVLNPTNKGLKPDLGEKVIVEKTLESHLNVVITPDLSPNLSELMPVSIDPRTIDLDTNSDTPVTIFSPELELMRGFIPMSVKRLDSVTSPAEFYDPAIRFEYTSAATGAKVGTVYAQDPARPDESMVFEWDTTFFKKYLPINSEANFITSSPGTSEKIRVHMTESAKFLIGAGGTDQDFEFTDNVNVVTLEDLQWKLRNNYKDSFTATVMDGPFKGFVPGYDSVVYDGPELYDAGRPPDIYSLLAATNLSDEDKTAILQRWNFYLINGNEVPTTAAQWAYVRNMMDVKDPNPGEITTSFGIPYQGAAFDFNATPNTDVGTTVEEFTQFKLSERGTGYDSNPYDTRPLDTLGIQKLMLYPSKVAPYQKPPYTPGMPWENYQAYLTTELPARIIEIHYPSTPPANLIYRAWIEGTDAPVMVPVVDKIDSTTVAIYVAQEAKVKITVSTS